MSAESLRACLGRRVVDATDAEPVGKVDHLVIDARKRAVTAIVIGGGKKAQVVDWSGIVGLGPDAVMIAGGAAHGPDGDEQRRAADGMFDVVGRRLLSDAGNELGVLDDLEFDTTTGDVTTLHVGDRTLPAVALLGIGSYAVVVSDAPQA